MYFPLNQITTNLNTNGEAYYIVSTNEPYNGKFFKTSKGNSYTGATPKDGPNLLIELNQPENTTITNKMLKKQILVVIIQAQMQHFIHQHM